MSQRIILTTPSLLLASAIAVAAEKVGGYKDGQLGPAEAGALLTVLFDADQSSDDWQQAFDTLRSIWDRAEGASTILNNGIGLSVPTIEVDTDDLVVLVNGDNRVERLVNLLRQAQETLVLAGEQIQEQANDNARLRAMVNAAAEAAPVNLEPDEPELGIGEAADFDDLPEGLKAALQAFFGGPSADVTYVDFGRAA